VSTAEIPRTLGVRLRGASWVPVWSVPAALRAVRAVLVVCGMFALTYKAIGNLQMATFAAFGGFATLVLSAFGGTRRDKLLAHTALAIAGSALLTIGTVVSSSTLVAALITVPVTFAVFFAGIAGPNAASGATAALLAYVLPAASPGTIGMVPDRLAGWWLASVAGTTAVLLLSPRLDENALRRDASRLAAALADELDAALAGDAAEDRLATTLEAKLGLLARFTATPYRPTGLAAADQALANVVELLEWCTALAADAVRERADLSDVSPATRRLVATTSQVLRDSSALLAGDNARPDVDLLERCQAEAATGLDRPPPACAGSREAAQASFHAHAIAVAALALATETLVAARVVDPAWLEARRRRWYVGTGAVRTARRVSSVVSAAHTHASVRSVWFVNSLRGAVALAAAVAVADLGSLQHGFWVVLGTLSVLRTNASATGSTALRALAGTAIGFALGAALLLGIGTSSTALWVALPIAVFVAGYAPGTTPFAVGQAGFTITIVVVFNLLMPAGWQVGLLRIEDVAIGCAVSVVVGLLFWPRGAGGLVGNDLADAFRRGGSYLAQAVDWALGLRAAPPDTAVSAVTASIRLDEALRAFLSEQGTKRLTKQDLWRLVMGSTRLRLTAYSVASLHDLNGHDEPDAVPVPVPAADAGAGAGAGTNGTDRLRSQFQHLTMELIVFYERVADQLAGSSPDDLAPIPAPALTGPALPVGVACAGNTPPQYQPDMLWVGEYLYHLGSHAGQITAPAAQIAELRQRSWWR
jgi:uncharacterized membrane protein YccC